jgi:hypothetical protein
MPSQADRDARIRDRAYQIWLSEGRRHGHHEAHWQQAVRELEAEEAASPGTRKASGSRTEPPVTGEADPPIARRARAKNGATAKKPRTRAAPAADSLPASVTSDRTKPASRPRAGAQT